VSNIALWCRLHHASNRTLALNEIFKHIYAHLSSCTQLSIDKELLLLLLLLEAPGQADGQES
jgi:hypothetical protein